MNDLSLHIIDIIQNSLSAGATIIGLRVNEDEAGNLLTIEIEDNGRGMTKEQTQRLSDPFLPLVQLERWGWVSPCSNNLQSRAAES